MWVGEGIEIPVRVCGEHERRIVVYCYGGKFRALGVIADGVGDGSEKEAWYACW